MKPIQSGHLAKSNELFLKQTEKGKASIEKKRRAKVVLAKIVPPALNWKTK